MDAAGAAALCGLRVPAGHAARGARICRLSGREAGSRRIQGAGLPGTGEAGGGAAGGRGLSGGGARGGWVLSLKRRLPSQVSIAKRLNARAGGPILESHFAKDVLSGIRWPHMLRAR
ncbi:protein of unknown function [Burkholderia multivorans]